MKKELSSDGLGWGVVLWGWLFALTIRDKENNDAVIYHRGDVPLVMFTFFMENLTEAGFDVQSVVASEKEQRAFMVDVYCEEVGKLGTCVLRKEKLGRGMTAIWVECGGKELLWQPVATNVAMEIEARLVETESVGIRTGDPELTVLQEHLDGAWKQVTDHFEEEVPVGA